jgi:hypothetical protein
MLEVPSRTAERRLEYLQDAATAGLTGTNATHSTHAPYRLAERRAPGSRGFPLSPTTGVQPPSCASPVSLASLRDTLEWVALQAAADNRVVVAADAWVAAWARAGLYESGEPRSGRLVRATVSYNWPVPLDDDLVHERLCRPFSGAKLNSLKMRRFNHKGATPAHEFQGSEGPLRSARRVLPTYSGYRSA